ncbi:MAG TPA: SDR family oxidoreductase [Planctomycetaceae bacterium]|jgi:NAD(P)-dependent dehydrogenase (short-subunit alcohol dehydrogenase family)|nr:SDR family oxidoreductase [Planctomycetaceae bacterium]
MRQLDQKVVVITGGNQGIGKGIARLFGGEGARLALCARNATKLAATAEELRTLGIDVLECQADVSSEAAVENFFKAVMERFGRVDILVNNAGNFDGGRIDTISLAAWNNVIGAALTGAFLCSRSAFRIMKEQGGGRILNIGSISGQRPREGSAPYASAKFGLWGLTNAVALDGRPYGILCSCLHPGNVRVEWRADPKSPGNQEPMMETETVARAALAMVTLPPDVNFLEAIILPKDQPYLGRG